MDIESEEERQEKKRKEKNLFNLIDDAMDQKGTKSKNLWKKALKGSQKLRKLSKDQADGAPGR